MIHNMSFFDNILKTHSFPKGTRYMWALKLTADEHDELKACLRYAGEQGRLKYLPREAALYYSQWWRCEYDGGHASIGDVCCSLFFIVRWSNVPNISHIIAILNLGFSDSLLVRMLSN